MSHVASNWVLNASNLPLGFAQVREDALIDVDIVSRLPPGPRVILVASGGCTAAMLASLEPSLLHLVDPNPAQMALSQLKLQLLTSANLEERLALLGHIPMKSEKRKQGLEKKLAKSGFSLDVLGPTNIISSVGPDFAGRYEFLFAKLREVLGDFGQAISDLLALEDVEAQSQRVTPTSSLGMVLDATFEKVMSLPNLMSLFGRDATGNRYQEFSRHFAWRTRSVFSTLPAATNPYLSQMLLGRFQSSVYFPWFMVEKMKSSPALQYSEMGMIEALELQKSASLDMVHLSNILDWLSPQVTLDTLQKAWRGLKVGGYVIIRQLNSTLDIRAIGNMFRWDAELSQHWLDRDRSFFYRGLHIGQKL